MTNVNKFKSSVVLVSIVLTGCGWVDSTGSQGGSNQSEFSTALSNPDEVIVNDGEAFSVQETTLRTVVFADSSRLISSWNWQLQEGAADVEACLAFDGFTPDITLNTLADTCADSNNCAVRIEETVQNGITRFNITPPPMRAPAALAYRFNTLDDNGNAIEKHNTICALSVNEAPDARDDTYTVTRGQFFEIQREDTNNLLANDEDDIDVRNEALRIDPIAVQTPRFAAKFELLSNGGFSYLPNDNAPLTVNGSVSDSFTYSVTDGTHISLATVGIKLVEFNSAPEQLGEIPEIKLVLDEQSGDPLLLNFNEYFADEQGDALSYRVLPGSLPNSGNIFVTSDGRLFGQASEDDIGEYNATLIVFDGVEETTTTFEFNVEATSVPNSAPGVTDINNRVVTGTFSYDVSVFFNDVNNDVLTYTATGLPPGINITRVGVILGTSGIPNRGRWLIRVTADDGNGGAVSDGFRLTIR